MIDLAMADPLGGENPSGKFAQHRPFAELAPSDRGQGRPEGQQALRKGCFSRLASSWTRRRAIPRPGFAPACLVNRALANEQGLAGLPRADADYGPSRRIASPPCYAQRCAARLACAASTRCSTCRMVRRVVGELRRKIFFAPAQSAISGGIRKSALDDRVMLRERFGLNAKKRR